MITLRILRRQPDRFSDGQSGTVSVRGPPEAFSSESFSTSFLLWEWVNNGHHVPRPIPIVLWVHQTFPDRDDHTLRSP